MYIHKQVLTAVYPVLLVLLLLLGYVFVIPRFDLTSIKYPFTNLLGSNKLIVDEDSPSVFQDYLEPIRLKPTRVYTPDKLIDANLIEVGLTETGQLEAPLDYNVGGWYKYSAHAGDQAQVIIDGHYDAPGGYPAAFWNLKILKEGDTISLEDEAGRLYVYQVNQILYVSIQDPNRIDKLLDGEGGTLTLITCNGVWIPSFNTYDERIIVKALLIS